MATIQVRFPDKKKKNVEKILESLGLDMTTAVRMFLNQVEAERGIPFPVSLNRNLVLTEIVHRHSNESDDARSRDA